MGNGIKGITVEIGGNTAPLDKALKDVNKTTRELQTELKQVDKGLKLDPNNITLVSQKQKILKEDIIATKEKLDALKEAQKQVKDQYKNGGIDEGQYRAFQRELENTKSKLKSLKEEKSDISVLKTAFSEVKDKVSEVTSKIEPVISGLKKVGSAAKDITDAGIKVVGTAVNKAGDALKAYAGIALGAGTALAGLSYKAAQSADDINTLAAQTGLSTDQIQKFQYASELIDVPLDTLTGSMAKLTKNMSSAQGGTGAAADAFKSLGINVTDSNGQLRSNQEVFNESITALGKMTNETQRDAYAMAIFGKSAQDLNPLIKGGADALKLLGDSADSAGLILNQNALNNLNKFNDSVDILKANSMQAGNVLAGVFAGGLQQTTDLIGTLIPKLTASVAQLFSGQNMKEAQSKLTADLISGANQIIKNIAEQLPTYINGLNAVIISVITAITSVLPNLINTILPTLINGLIALVNGILPEIPVLLPIIVNGAIQLFMGLLNGLNIIVPQLMAMIPGIIQNVSNILIQNLPLIITAGVQLLVSLITGITQCLPQLINAVVALIPVITTAIIQNLPALINAGIQLIIALAQGLPKAIPAIIAALPLIISAIINGLISVNWLNVGGQITAGIAEGLWEGIKSINFSKLGDSLLKGFKNALGIHSPSRLFHEVIGTNLALGIGEGFTEQMKTVTDDMTKAIPTQFNTDISAGANKRLNSSASEIGTSGNQSNTTINFNGSYTFGNQKDIDYFMNQAALMVQRKRG